MATNFPTSLDDGATVGDGTNPGAAEALSSTTGQPVHSGLHQNVGLALTAIESKVGTGASTAASGKVLTGTGSGTSGWAEVATAMIAADAVDGTKIADDAIDSEHYAAGSIDTAHIADAQITVAKMAANSVDSNQYVDGSIDTAHIADSQITLAKMAANSVDSDQYVDRSIDAIHIATGTITATELGAGSVDTSELAASAVETAKINNSAVTTAKIDDDAVTSAKMAATVAVDTAFSVGALTSGRILSTNSSGAVDFYRSTSTTTDGILVLRSDVSSTGANKFLAYANGDVATTTGTYGSISDARLKDIIGPSVDRLAQINDMEVIKYRLTKTTDDEGNIVDLDTPSHEMLGFSAQQLQTVAPGLVKEVEHGILNVKTSVIVPMLVKAVQELTARLEALETA